MVGDDDDGDGVCLPRGLELSYKHRNFCYRNIGLVCKMIRVIL